jgi:hypothetical protein
LGSWKDDGGTLTFVEEGIPYQVDVLELSRHEFRYRVHDPGGGLEVRLVPAEGVLLRNQDPQG